MRLRNVFDEREFAFIIHKAMYLVGCWDWQIKEKHTNFLEYHLNTDSKRIHKYTIQIRFDTENTNLYCIFNPHRICIGVFISPDYLCHIADYMIYMYSQYKCDRQKKRWKLPNGYFKIIGKEMHKFNLWVTI